MESLMYIVRHNYFILNQGFYELNLLLAVIGKLFEFQI